MKTILFAAFCLFVMGVVLLAKETAVAGEPNEIVPCEDGKAGTFPCDNVNMLARITLSKLGGQDGNDIWGWTDPETGKEYALMGLNTGTAFVDVSDPVNPIYLGNLPTHTVNSIWRDIKVYNNHAYIVSEAAAHGLQIFDLTQLRSVSSPLQTFSETAYYDGFGSAHNIAINEDTAYAYAVGTNTCAGGLHMVDILDPINPVLAGCFSEDGYTHDAQCVSYQGPDTDYPDNEICFNANEDTFTIADVTDKENPAMVARKGYPGGNYTHQGWITEDHTYFLLNDELDEINNGHNTRTYIWDVSDLDNPQLVDTYTAKTPAIDHNHYVHNGLLYQANYRAGLRVLDLENISEGSLNQIAYFDTYPTNNNTGFNGAWSVYPFFESGTIIVSDINRGLFILKMDLTPPPPTYEIFLPLITG